jgi:hypothetical protein
VANLAPGQIRNRERVETLIRLMAPGLNLILSAGERLSRIVEPEDTDYYPVRPPTVEPPPPKAGGAEPPD